MKRPKQKRARDWIGQRRLVLLPVPDDGSDLRHEPRNSDRGELDGQSPSQRAFPTTSVRVCRECMESVGLVVVVHGLS